MKLRLLSVCVIASSALYAFSISPREAADAILSRNGDYLSAIVAKDAKNIEAQTHGNAPDPEISGGYMIAPKGETNRWDVGVSYAMEWPGVYAARRSMGKVTRNANDAEILALANAKRLEILTKIEEYLYADQRLNLMQQMADATDSIQILAEKSRRGGQMSQLDLAKVSLERGRVDSELAKIKNDKVTLEGELTTLNGGYNAKALLESIDRNVIAEPLMPLDSYIDGAKSNPDFMKALADFEAAKQYVKVANAENLPSLSIGYAHEFEDGMHFNGANLGVSIPLFSTRGKKKAAKAAVAAAEHAATAVADRTESEVKALYDQVVALDKALEVPKQIFSSTDYTALLLKSYRGGEISLVDYLQERTWFIETYLDFLEQTYLRAITFNTLHSLTQSH